MRPTLTGLLGAVVLAATIGSATPVSAESKHDAIEISKDGRHFQRADGRAFLYMADTAWALFHRLNREQADRYLKDRTEKGLSVIQAVALSELNGLVEPNAHGHLPLADQNPSKPNEAYFAYVDYVVQRCHDAR